MAGAREGEMRIDRYIDRLIGRCMENDTYKDRKIDRHVQRQTDGRDGGQTDRQAEDGRDGGREGGLMGSDRYVDRASPRRPSRSLPAAAQTRSTSPARTTTSGGGSSASMQSSLPCSETRRPTTLRWLRPQRRRTRPGHLRIPFLRCIFPASFFEPDSLSQAHSELFDGVVGHPLRLLATSPLLLA